MDHPMTSLLKRLIKSDHSGHRICCCCCIFFYFAYHKVLYESRGLSAVFLFFRQAYIQDRLVFKTGLCAVLHPSDRYKITYCTQICTQRPIHHTHFLCRVYSRGGLYSRAAYMQHSPPKREAFIRDRLIFKGGFYTRLYGKLNQLMCLLARHSYTYIAGMHALTKEREALN